MKELLPSDVQMKDATTVITSKTFLDSWKPSIISAEVLTLSDLEYDWRLFQNRFIMWNKHVLIAPSIWLGEKKKTNTAL